MKKEIAPIDRISRSIYLFRAQKALLDFDLAALYGVTTKVFNQAIKRNSQRFPEDFMFRLGSAESASLTNWSQFVTSSRKHRGKRYRPYAFTEQGVAMLSSVLRSERAIEVNIAIMRAFVMLRKTLETNRELAQKFAELEERVGKHDKKIGAILDAIRQLMSPSEKPRREIGFHVREKSARYRTARNGR
jgi:hypothetical protein